MGSCGVAAYYAHIIIELKLAKTTSLVVQHMPLWRVMSGNLPVCTSRRITDPLSTKKIHRVTRRGRKTVRLQGSGVGIHVVNLRRANPHQPCVSGCTQLFQTTHARG
jgi:hypothetical protein